MIKFRYLTYASFLLAFMLMCYGCATIFNGSTQEVSFSMPEGTEIIEENGEEPFIIYSGKGSAILRLKRKKDYLLRFSYKDQEMSRRISSSLEGGWLIADLFAFYGIGYVVDAITGAWFSFDDRIFVRFPKDKVRDSTQSLSLSERPVFEYNRGLQRTKLGGIFTAFLGLNYPKGTRRNNGYFSVDIPLQYGISVGYEVLPRLSLLLSNDGSSNISVLPHSSAYRSVSDYSTNSIGVRFRMHDNIYLSGGGGWTHITSDSLVFEGYGYDIDGRRYDLSNFTAPVDVSMPSLYVGIGIAGSLGFFELRHSFGLSKISLSNGEIGKFQTTSIAFGLNVKF